jgi:hypothetical protein
VLHSDETAELEPGELDGDVLNDFTLSGTMKGTPGFMAPEQADGKSPKTPETDVYALGAILYMLLVHEVPVEGESANEVIENTLAGNIVPLRRREGKVPAGLDAVAMKALALVPENRYPTVQSLQYEISLYMTGYPTAAERAGLLRRVVLLTQRHAVVALLSLVSLVVLVAVGIAAIARVERERTDALEAKAEAEELNLDLTRTLEYFAVQPDMRHPFLNIEILDKKLAGELEPELHKELLMQKGVLHFIVEEFNAAVECFEQSGVGYSTRLLDPARHFASIKLNDKVLLKESELAEMFTFDPPVFKQFTYYTYLHHARRNENPDLEDYRVLAGTILEEMNGPRPKDVYRLDIRKGARGYILDLSGKPYSRYKLLIPGVLYSNVLQPYRFEHLDISHTPLTDFLELENLEVETLRMVGMEWLTSNRFLQQRLKNMGVKTLIVEKGKLPDGLRRKLRENLELVEE